MTLSEVLKAMPWIAVLRHLQPAKAHEIGETLCQAGFLCLEVPLNSPDPFDSIRILAEGFSDRALIGAGTVIKPADVAKVADAGGEIIIMPHTDVDVIHEAKRLGLTVVPGISTPSEAYLAIRAGADALKLFPAIGNPPNVVKAIRAILPPDMPLIPTGGINPDMMADYMAAGANGFGLGGALFKPSDAAAVVRQKADTFISAMQKIQASNL